MENARDRKRVPAIVTLEEGYFWHKQQEGNEGTSLAEFTEKFRKFTKYKKRQIYNEIVANILTDFLVGFHWHGVNARKGRVSVFQR